MTIGIMRNKIQLGDCSKSILQTEKYIKHYVKNHGEHYYFSIVLDNEEFHL